MLYELLWGDHEDECASESMIAECGLKIHVKVRKKR
jgi:hypothetical protein